LKLIHIFIALIASFGLLHIDFNSLESTSNLDYKFIYDKDSQETIYSENIDKNKNKTFTNIFHYKNKEENLFNVVNLSENGQLQQSFQIKEKKKGYITYPDNGAFYIYYSSLGTQIKFYDNKGVFLLEKKESRYIKSFSQGEWLMAVSGDHSRIEFVKPNLDHLFSIEGNILFKYQLSDKNTRYNACISSISGDVFFINIKKKKEKYLSTKLLMKSMSCDLKNGDFITQVKDKYSTKDSIVFYNIEKDNNDVSIEDFTEKKMLLKNSYNYTLPISMHPSGFSLVPYLTKNHLEVLLVDNQNIENKFTISLKKYVDGKYDLDDFRSFIFLDKIILWNESHLFVFNHYGLNYYKKLSNAILVKINYKSLLIQEEKNIFAMKIGNI